MAKGMEFNMGGECPHMLPAYAAECGYGGKCPHQEMGHYLPLCGRGDGPLPVRAKVIINESHDLFPAQEALLAGFRWERLDVPASGWTLSEINEIAEGLWERYCQERFRVIFASPVPALLKLVLMNFDSDDVLIFHNDRRDKVELPDGRVINRVATTGWQLV